MDGENPQIYVSAISTCATADFAAIMAKASTLYEYTDKEFADQCIEAAEKAWAYLKKHEENISFQNETGITSREYSDDSDADERFWAAIELYLATGEEEYRNKAKEYDLDHAAIEFGWSDVAGYACFDFYTRVDKKETELYKKIEKVLKREVQETKENSDLGYRINSQYAVGSLQQVLNRAVLLCLMDKETKKESSASYVKNYLNYVMGENPESKNAFQEMISEKKDQTVEVSSALLVVIQGLDDK